LSLQFSLAGQWTGLGDGVTFGSTANWGSLTLPGASDDVVINAGGTVIDVSGGSYAIRSIMVDAGRTLQLSGGSLTVTQASALGGGLTVMGGTLTLDGATSVADAFNMSGGTLGGSGNLTVAGATALTAGTLGGTGTLTTTGAVSVGDVSLARVWNAQGTTSLTAANIVRFNGGTINNSGSWNLNGTQVSPLLNSGGTNAFNNTGTLTKTTGTVASISVPLNNASSGVVNVNGGTLGASALTQSGTLRVDSGTTFSKPGGFTNDGVMTGGGTIDVAGGALVNAGTIRPDGGGADLTGTLSVIGNFTQTSAGTLELQVEGATAGLFDRLAISAVATLDGTLSLASASGYVPNTSHVFDLVTYGSANGTFAVTDAPAFAGFGVDYGANSTSFKALIGCLVDICWIGSSGDWSIGANWNTGVAPSAGQRVRVSVAGPQTVTLSTGSFNLSDITSDENLILSGGSLTTSGAFTLGAGTFLDLAGASLTVNGTLTTPVLNLSAGTLGGSGAITVNSDFNQTGGSFSPTGSLDLTRILGTFNFGAANSNGIVRLATTGGFDIRLNGNIQTTNNGLAANAAAITVTAAGNINLASTTNITAAGSGAIVMGATGSVDLKANDFGTSAVSNSITAAGNLDITATSGQIVRTDGDAVTAAAQSISLNFATGLDPDIGLSPTTILNITQSIGNLNAGSFTAPALNLRAPNGNVVFAPGSQFSGGPVTVSGGGSAIFDTGFVTFNSALISSLPLVVSGAGVAFNDAVSTPAFSMVSGSSIFAQSPSTTQLTQSGGTITVSSGAVSAGNWSIQGGSLQMPAAHAAIAADGVLQVEGGHVDYGADLVVNGNLVLGSSGSIAGNGAIHVIGTLTKTGPGSFTVTNPLINSGTVSVQAGALVLAGGGSHTSLFASAPGANLDFDGGTHLFANGSRISGAGSFDGGGVLQLVGNSAGLLIGADASIDLGAMGFTGSGVLSNQGTVTGQMASLPGDFINRAGATASLTDVVIGGSLFNYGNFNTGGVVRVGGTQIRQLGGVLSVPGGANLDMTHPAGLFSWQDGTIGGTGTLGFSGGGNFLFAGNGERVIDGLNFAFNNLVLPDGSLTLQSGSLTLSGATVLPAGVALNLVGGTLANNGSLDIAGSFSLTGGAFGGTGSLSLSGGQLSLPTGNSVAWTNSGALTNTGTLNLAGSTITNAVNNQGTINLGGGLTFTQSLLNTGTVSAQDGTSVFAGGLTQSGNSSVIALSGGNLQGDVTILAGTIMGTGMVNGNLVVGAANVAPGASPGAITITGNLSLNPASVMNLEIAGLVQGTGYDFVYILGNASLAGTLNVNTIGGFVAPAGSSFAVMQYASSSGAFSLVNLPASVRAFTFSSGPTALTLSAASDVVPFPVGPGFNPISTALGRVIAPDDAVVLIQGVARIEPEDAREIEMEGCR